MKYLKGCWQLLFLSVTPSLHSPPEAPFQITHIASAFPVLWGTLTITRLRTIG
jgi:hypothetical protein